jgi:hypothetical protein
MIKTFPEFTPLDAELRNEVTKICSRFEPYSDFNFTSLLCWDTDGSTSVSLLRGNLVLRMPDYISGEHIYSFIGDKSVDDCLIDILKVAQRLELVPDNTINEIQHPERFIIEEDLDQADYIYSLSDHATLGGGHFKAKRKILSRFLKTYGEDLVAHKIILSNHATREQIINAFDLWASQKTILNSEDAQERKALLRLLKYSSEVDIKGYLITINNKVAGFSITEVLDDDFAIYHFQKTLHKYHGSDIYLTKISSEQLKNLGCKYINWEQDLGIGGLRDSKRGYRPIYMLKKYSIELDAV